MIDLRRMRMPTGTDLVWSEPGLRRSIARAGICSRRAEGEDDLTCWGAVGPRPVARSQGGIPQTRAASNRRASIALGPPDDDAECLRVFEDHTAYVRDTLRRLGTRPRDVDDLTQDVFLALRGCWKSCDKTRPLRPFLFGITFRIACAHWRKWRREVPLGDEQSDPVDIEDDPERVLQRKQAKVLISAAMERIAPHKRSVLVMHDLEGDSVENISRQLKIKRGAVYTRLKTSRRELGVILRRLLRRTAEDPKTLCRDSDAVYPVGAHAAWAFADG